MKAEELHRRASSSVSSASRLLDDLDIGAAAADEGVENDVDDDEEEIENEDEEEDTDSINTGESILANALLW